MTLDEDSVGKKIQRYFDAFPSCVVCKLASHIILIRLIYEMVLKPQLVAISSSAVLL